MTCLAPVYTRAKLEVPKPTRAKALTSFPLDMSRPSVTDVTLQSANNILAKVTSIIQLVTLPPPSKDEDMSNWDDGVGRCRSRTSTSRRR